MGSAYWMYDATLYVYALSLLFYFSDFVHFNRKANRVGAGLLVFVWVLQTGYFISRLIMESGEWSKAPFGNLFIFSWLLVTVSIIIDRFFYIEFIVFFANVIGFAMLALSFYSNPTAGRPFELWQTTKELLFVHISLVFPAFVSLTIGALLSGMYMFLHNRLKAKRWTSIVRRFPSLDKIDRYIERTVIIGVPLLTLSLAVAITSLFVEGRPQLILDWKVLTALSGLLLYVRYIYLRAVSKKTGMQLSRLFLLAYAMLVINAATDSFSSFH